MEKTETQAKTCASWIEKASRIVLLSGAGLSTAAGIPDFRGPEGLYRRAGVDNPEALFDIERFDRDPSLFYRFHREFLRLFERITPTFTHRFFAALEARGAMEAVVTQNIDGLHQAAGSKKVLEIHGGIGSNHCRRCGASFTLDSLRTLMAAEEIPHCRCGGVIKPDVVFFGEAVRELEACQRATVEADLLVVAGSSLVVTPAAFLPSLCQGKIVVVNRGDFSERYLPRRRIDLFAEEDIDAFFHRVDDGLNLVAPLH
ncbi:RNA polymerase subunit sigma [Aminithiophilus ramosus]|uniref:protein acetyllysine N-acetyltransferase n=1 Tax=Aminithiophilus ramosus TaxID=3029084 RepID=A0A9Q7EXT0_9BACT|nr:Sir2 family NAD-dependent protein deacetylase [Aminithiophilus ramosus]QTX32785.1 RNA polymerase subunit sigma [Aminithiophilus ramosus]